MMARPATEPAGERAGLPFVEASACAEPGRELQRVAIDQDDDGLRGIAELAAPAPRRASSIG